MHIHIHIHTAQQSTEIKDPKQQEQENKTEECSVGGETEETRKINLI
jgi:hypothetical protein